jgi:hypothetical protein
MKSIADEIRVIHKELGWIMNHLANIYQAVKSDDDTAIVDVIDPRQMSLFPDDGEKSDNL